MPLWQIPLPGSAVAVTTIEKPGGATVPTVNFIECALASGQGVSPEGQLKVAVAEEFDPGANVSTVDCDRLKRQTLPVLNSFTYRVPAVSKPRPRLLEKPVAKVLTLLPPAGILWTSVPPNSEV